MLALETNETDEEIQQINELSKAYWVHVLNVVFVLGVGTVIPRNIAKLRIDIGQIRTSIVCFYPR